MRRIFLVVAAVGVVAAMVGFSGLVAGAKPGKAKQNLVTGKGTLGGGNEISYENVRSDSNGQKPKGRFEFRSSDGTFFVEGKVKCLRVKGNRAVLAGKITESSDSDQFPFGTFQSVVEDNGSTTDGSPDKVNISVVQNSEPLPPPECPPFVEPGSKLEDGNIKVRDAK